MQIWHANFSSEHEGNIIKWALQLLYNLQVWNIPFYNWQCFSSIIRGCYMYQSKMTNMKNSEDWF